MREMSLMRAVLLLTLLLSACGGEEPTVSEPPNPGDIYACTSTCPTSADPGTMVGCIYSVRPCDEADNIELPAGCGPAVSQWIAPRELPVCGL